MAFDRNWNSWTNMVSSHLCVMKSSHLIQMKSPTSTSFSMNLNADISSERESLTSIHVFILQFSRENMIWISQVESCNFANDIFQKLLYSITLQAVTAHIFGYAITSFISRKPSVPLEFKVDISSFLSNFAA